MADRGQQGFAGMEEERQRDTSREGGHASHEKGNSHEFDSEEASESGRKGAQARQMVHASRETTRSAEGHSAEIDRDTGGSQANGGMTTQGGEQTTSVRPRRTRGGTHDQHVTAGKKGGSRIRELIELGYKYEEEHGIGPGRNERSKLSAKRRTTKKQDQGIEEQEPADEGGDENA